MNDPLQVVFALTFPILLGAAIVVAILLWRGTGIQAPDVLAPPSEKARGGRALGDLRIFAVWLVLSGATVVVLFTVGFAVVHAVLFVFGQGAATLTLVSGSLLLVAVPVAWGLAIRHHLRGGRS